MRGYYRITAAGLAVFVLLGVLLMNTGLSVADEGAEVTQTESAEAESLRLFDAEIAPLLARHCLECHDTATQEGGLDLSRREAALEGGDGGPAIVPGDHMESLAWDLADLGDMPPPDEREPLTEEQLELIREWIDTGAVWSSDTIDASALTRDSRAAQQWIQRLTVPEYIETVRSAVGVDIADDARRILPKDVRADGFTNTAYSLSIDLRNVEAYAELAALIVERMDVLAFAAEYSDCRDLDDDCVRPLIAEMGKWLLRAPLSEQEVDDFHAVARAVEDEGGDFEEAVSYVLEAMLQSPRFIYRIENQRGEGGMRPVGDYELASRLSYFIWGAPPDKPLMKAADAGELSDPAVVADHVERMLEDPLAKDRSAQFVSEWLNLGGLETLSPNAEKFPEWSPQLARDMQQETLASFEHIVWDEQRPMWDLINAEVTYATPRLAEHYDLDPERAAPVPGRSEIAEAPSRVTEGLQALYTFEETSGDTVHDVSDAGEPINLTIGASAVITGSSTGNWGPDGLLVDGSTLIASTGAPTRLIEAVEDSNAITLEAWVSPANTTQDGPARILTLSADTSNRNFTLGQDGGTYNVRLRTTDRDNNGMPAVVTPGDTVRTQPTHVVYTRDADGNARLYVDGQITATEQVEGDFANWDEDYRLALAAELSNDRYWSGTLHLVAVYNQALSSEQVRRNRAAGARRGQPPERAATANLQALYRFDERDGDTVHDTADAGDPLDLEIDDPSAVNWSGDGLSVESPTVISADEPPARLMEALRDSGQVTLEAWVTPANTSQEGPARILTLSRDTTNRNFTLGQEADVYDVRYRTSETNSNGQPSVSSREDTVRTRPTHIVYTRDERGTATLYVDGRDEGTRRVAGDLSNWQDDFQLAIANELSGDRAWQGTLHRVAIYDRAFSHAQVRQNRAVGPREDTAPALAGDHGLEALYVFDEGGGDTVHDASGNAEPLDLQIEDASAVNWTREGLSVEGETLIATASPANRLADAARRSGEVSLEAWVTPQNTEQDGPARILSYSDGTSARNFTLGQAGETYNVRLRTSATDANGMPGLDAPGGSAATRPVHIVYTRNVEGQARLYLDGEKVSEENIEGDFSNWDSAFRLALGNETSNDRPWRGTFHRVAVFSRALTLDEIRARGNTLSRYDVTDTPRGGLLTQGSVLTKGGDEASMVSRGLFVLHDLLDSAVGSAPPCVDTTPVPADEGSSRRTIAESRLADSSCGGCHIKFEPLAFSLEQFDGIGAYWEQDEHGNEVREDGQVLFPGTAEPVSYETAEEFRDLLADSGRVRKTFTRKLTQFAIGRPLVESDTPIVDDIHETAREGGGTYADLITAIVMSDLVQKTRTETDP